MTKTQYITAVHEAIDESNVDSGDVIQVRLLLSIDRRMSAEQAMDVVDLAISFKNGVVAVGHGAECHGLVVGVDLCGTSKFFGLISSACLQHRSASPFPFIDDFQATQ